MDDLRQITIKYTDIISLKIKNKLVKPETREQIEENSEEWNSKVNIWIMKVLTYMMRSPGI